MLTTRPPTAGATLGVPDRERTGVGHRGQVLSATGISRGTSDLSAERSDRDPRTPTPLRVELRQGTRPPRLVVQGLSGWVSHHLAIGRRGSQGWPGRSAPADTD